MQSNPEFSRFLLIISSQTGNKEINVHEYSEICKIVRLTGILKKTHAGVRTPEDAVRPS
jgi:hypothetical protein